MSVGRLVGRSVGLLVGNAFVRRSTRRTLLAYLALLSLGFPLLAIGFRYYYVSRDSILYLAILAVGCQVKMDDTADALDGVCGETG